MHQVISLYCHYIVCDTIYGIVCVCVCYLNILGTTAAPSAAAQARGDRGHQLALPHAFYFRHDPLTQLDQARRVDWLAPGLAKPESCGKRRISFASIRANFVASW